MIKYKVHKIMHATMFHVTTSVIACREIAGDGAQNIN